MDAKINFEAVPAELAGRTITSMLSIPENSTEIGQSWLTRPLLGDIACLERLEQPNRAAKIDLDAFGGSPALVPGTSEICMPRV